VGSVGRVTGRNTLVPEPLTVARFREGKIA
jgi:hypothetical protein